MLLNATFEKLRLALGITLLAALIQTIKKDGFEMKVQRMHGQDLSEASPYATRPLAFQARVSYLKVTQTKLCTLYVRDSKNFLVYAGVHFT